MLPRFQYLQLKGQPLAGPKVYSSFKGSAVEPWACIREYRVASRVIKRTWIISA